MISTWIDQRLEFHKKPEFEIDKKREEKSYNKSNNNNCLSDEFLKFND